MLLVPALTKSRSTFSRMGLTTAEAKELQLLLLHISERIEIYNHEQKNF